MSKYKTVTELVQVEPPPTKGSRFIGLANHAPTVQAALAFLDTVRTDHPRATHHTFAWIIDEDTSRMSDDGEPKGTAGRPIFDRIKGQGLSQTAIVVVRYYGGTKLGTGGLVRAYGAAATAALENATIVEKERCTIIGVRCPYELEGPIKGVIKEYAGELIETEWAADVAMKISVTSQLHISLLNALREIGSGRIVIERG